METDGHAVRWGVLSTANIARYKVIPGFRRAKRTRIMAVASRDLARAKVVADELAIPRVHGSYEQLLADPEIDAVYVPLPNHMHREWTMAAAQAGKHVLCEKPLSTSSADARAMVDACANAGVVLMEAFMYRLHPTWRAVRELVADGRIGTLAAIQTWFGYHNDDAGNIRNIAAYGGGALYDVGCYAVNLSRLLFGSEPTGVRASIVRDATSGVDVSTSAILEFGDGVSTFTVSIRTEPDQRVDLYGSTGRITIPIPFNIPPDRPTEVLVVAGGDPPVAPNVERLAFPIADPYAVEAEAFARVLLDGEPVPFPLDDPVANLRVIERIFASAQDRAVPAQ